VDRSSNNGNAFQLGKELLEHLQDLLLVIDLVLHGLVETALEVNEALLICAVELCLEALGGVEEEVLGVGLLLLRLRHVRLGLADLLRLRLGVGLELLIVLALAPGVFQRPVVVARKFDAVV